MLKCDIFLLGKSFTTQHMRATHSSEQQVEHLEWAKEDCVTQALLRQGKPPTLFNAQNPGSTFLPRKEQELPPETLTASPSAALAEVVKL